jgi:hypothetical protein
MVTVSGTDLWLAVDRVLHRVVQVHNLIVQICRLNWFIFVILNSSWMMIAMYFATRKKY